MFRVINSLLTLPKGVLYILVSFLYVSAIIVIRWNLIAVPLRQHLRVAINSAWARLEVEAFGNQSDEKTNADEQIKRLLNDAKKQLDTSIWDKIFWSRGREMNGWRYVHEAGRLMAVLYSPAMVETRLRGAVSELRDIKGREACDLADNIEAELKVKEKADIKIRRALLQGALAFIYDKRDNRYSELDTWDNEAMWMVTSGLLLIAVLGFAAGNTVLFVVGATGGFLGRLTNLFKVKFGSADYGLYWDPLFMSPVLGALAGWTGVLLVTFMGSQGLGILGSFVDQVSWSNPNSYALSLAFLFGLSERFFGNLVTGAESQIASVKSGAEKTAEGK